MKDLFRLLFGFTITLTIIAIFLSVIYALGAWIIQPLVYAAFGLVVTFKQAISVLALISIVSLFWLSINFTYSIRRD